MIHRNIVFVALVRSLCSTVALITFLLHALCLYPSPGGWDTRTSDPCNSCTVKVAAQFVSFWKAVICARSGGWVLVVDSDGITAMRPAAATYNYRPEKLHRRRRSIGCAARRESAVFALFAVLWRIYISYNPNNAPNPPPLPANVSQFEQET